jgi:hypothetical protein
MYMKVVRTPAEPSGNQDQKSGGYISLLIGSSRWAGLHHDFLSEIKKA